MWGFFYFKIVLLIDLRERGRGEDRRGRERHQAVLPLGALG